LRAINDPQALHAIGGAIGHELKQMIGFRGPGGYDNFADVAVRHAVLRAEFIGQMVAPDTVTGFERAGGVIDAGMNDAAVSSAGSHSKFWESFEEKYVTPVLRHRSRDGASNNPAAYDDYLRSIHGDSDRLCVPESARAPETQDFRNSARPSITELVSDWRKLRMTLGIRLSQSRAGKGNDQGSIFAAMDTKPHHPGFELRWISGENY